MIKHSKSDVTKILGFEAMNFFFFLLGGGGGGE